jgi:hypothetical protein
MKKRLKKVTMKKMKISFNLTMIWMVNLLMMKSKEILKMILRNYNLKKSILVNQEIKMLMDQLMKNMKIGRTAKELELELMMMNPM